MNVQPYGAGPVDFNSDELPLCLLEGVTDKARYKIFFQIAYQDIPRDQRANLVARVSAVAKDIPTTWQRRMTLLLLANLAPQQRQDAIADVVALLRLCETPAEAEMVRNFVNLVPDASFSTLLAYLRALNLSEWHAKLLELAPLAPVDRFKIISQ